MLQKPSCLGKVIGQRVIADNKTPATVSNLTGAQLCIAVLHKCRANGTKLGRQTVYSGLQHDNGLVVRYETPWRCLCQRVDIRLGWLPAQFYGITTIYVNVTAGNMAACFMPLRVLCTALFSIFSQNCCMFMCCAFNLLFHMLHADESAGTEVQIAQICGR